jgi:anti-anti-sigma factor
MTPMASLDLAHTHGAASLSILAERGAAAMPESAALATLQRKGLLLRASRQGERLVLWLDGKLDTATAPLLRRLIEENGQGQHLDLELSNCTRADGVGLAVLARLTTMLHAAGGSLRVLNPSPALRLTIMQVRLHHLLDILETAPSEDRSTAH